MQGGTHIVLYQPDKNYSYRLIKGGGVEMKIAITALIADILTILLQKCSLSGPLPDLPF